MVWSYFAPNLRISLKGRTATGNSLDLLAWRKAHPNPKVGSLVQEHLPHVQFVQDRESGRPQTTLPKTNSSHLSGGRNPKGTHLSIPWCFSCFCYKFQGGFTHLTDPKFDLFASKGSRECFPCLVKQRWRCWPKSAWLSLEKIRNTARYLGYVGTYTALFRMN